MPYYYLLMQTKLKSFSQELSANYIQQYIASSTTSILHNLFLQALIFEVVTYLTNCKFASIEKRIILQAKTVE